MDKRNGFLTEKLFEGLTPISTLGNVALNFWFQSEIFEEYCVSDGIFDLSRFWPRPGWVQLLFGYFNSLIFLSKIRKYLLQKGCLQTQPDLWAFWRSIYLAKEMCQIAGVAQSSLKP